MLKTNRTVALIIGTMSVAALGSYISHAAVQSTGVIASAAQDKTTVAPLKWQDDSPAFYSPGFRRVSSGRAYGYNPLPVAGSLGSPAGQHLDATPLPHAPEAGDDWRFARNVVASGRKGVEVINQATGEKVMVWESDPGYQDAMSLPHANSQMVASAHTEPGGENQADTQLTTVTNDWLDTSVALVEHEATLTDTLTQRVLTLKSDLLVNYITLDTKAQDDAAFEGKPGSRSKYEIFSNGAVVNRTSAFN